MNNIVQQSGSTNVSLRSVETNSQPVCWCKRRCWMDTLELSLLVVSDANTILAELTYDDAISVNNMKFTLTVPLSLLCEWMPITWFDFSFGSRQVNASRAIVESGLCALATPRVFQRMHSSLTLFLRLSDKCMQHTRCCIHEHAPELHRVGSIQAAILFLE